MARDLERPSWATMPEWPGYTEVQKAFVHALDHAAYTPEIHQFVFNLRFRMGAEWAATQKAATKLDRAIVRLGRVLDAEDISAARATLLKVIQRLERRGKSLRPRAPHPGSAGTLSAMMARTRNFGTAEAIRFLEHLRDTGCLPKEILEQLPGRHNFQNTMRVRISRFRKKHLLKQLRLGSFR